MDKTIKLIIACEAFRGELSAFEEAISAPVLWIEQALHNIPDQLHTKILAKIKEAEEILKPGETVLLFLGNCGGALKGIYLKSLNLSYPDVDDCIPVILGSMEKFKSLQAERPGSFYLNKNWIDACEDPLNSSNKYITTYGEKKGWKVAKLMYKNYTHFVLIDNGCYELDSYRKHVQESCVKFEKDYLEEKGSLGFIDAILKRECPMVNIAPNPQGQAADQYKSRAAFFPIKGE
jgi:hypothetical protein